MADEANSAGNAGSTAVSTSDTSTSTATSTPASATVTTPTKTDQSTTGGANASTAAPSTTANAPAAKPGNAKVGGTDASTLAGMAGKAPVSGADLGKANQQAAVPKEAAAPDADKPVTRGELDAYFAGKAADAAKHSATLSHNSTLASQVETLTAKVSDAFQGLPEALRAPLVDSMLRKYDDARLNATYPEGHPLHGEVCGVLDQAGIDALIQQASDLKSSIRAGMLAQIGQGANAFRPSVAGNNAAQGTAQAAPAKRQNLTDYVGAAVDNAFASRKQG